MGVIIVVCTAFGLTVSKAKMEKMCLRTKRMPEPIVMFNIEAASLLKNQTNKFVYLRGNLTHNAHEADPFGGICGVY